MASPNQTAQKQSRYRVRRPVTSELVHPARLRPGAVAATPFVMAALSDRAAELALRSIFLKQARFANIGTFAARFAARVAHAIARFHAPGERIVALAPPGGSMGWNPRHAGSLSNGE